MLSEPAFKWSDDKSLSGLQRILAKLDPTAHIPKTREEVIAAIQATAKGQEVLSGCEARVQALPGAVVAPGSREARSWAQACIQYNIEDQSGFLSPSTREMWSKLQTTDLQGSQIEYLIKQHHQDLTRCKALNEKLLKETGPGIGQIVKECQRIYIEQLKSKFDLLAVALDNEPGVEVEECKQQADVSLEDLGEKFADRLKEKNLEKEFERVAEDAGWWSKVTNFVTSAAIAYKDSYVEGLKTLWEWAGKGWQLLKTCLSYVARFISFMVKKAFSLADWFFQNPIMARMLGYAVLMFKREFCQMLSAQMGLVEYRKRPPVTQRISEAISSSASSAYELVSGIGKGALLDAVGNFMKSDKWNKTWDGAKGWITTGISTACASLGGLAAGPLGIAVGGFLSSVVNDVFVGAFKDTLEQSATITIQVTQASDNIKLWLKVFDLTDCIKPIIIDLPSEEFEHREGLKRLVMREDGEIAMRMYRVLVAPAKQIVGEEIHATTLPDLLRTKAEQAKGAQTYWSKIGTVLSLAIPGVYLYQRLKEEFADHIHDADPEIWHLIHKNEIFPKLELPTKARKLEQAVMPYVRYEYLRLAHEQSDVLNNFAATKSSEKEQQARDTVTSVLDETRGGNDIYGPPKSLLARVLGGKKVAHGDEAFLQGWAQKVGTEEPLEEEEHEDRAEEAQGPPQPLEKPAGPVKTKSKTKTAKTRGPKSPPAAKAKSKTAKAARAGTKLRQGSV